MNLTYPIAIRAYDREIKTLNFLKPFKNKVTIFIEDKEHAEKIGLPDTDWKYVLTGKCRTKNPLIKKNNYIYDYYKKDKCVLIMDDDLSGLFKLNSDHLTKLSSRGIYQMIEYGWKMMEKYNTVLWGIYPVYNAFYMKQKINFCGYIVGCFVGKKIDKNIIENVYPKDIKEDYLYMAEVIKHYGRVVRLDNFCMKTKYYASGGMNNYRREYDEINMVKKMIKMYPWLFKQNRKKKKDVEVINIFR